MFILSALTSLTLLAALSAASSAREITLAEVITLAREHAPALAAAEASARASHSMRRTVESERFGTLSLSSSAVYQSENSSLNLTIPGLPPVNREIGTHEIFQNELRYTIPLWTGGRLGSSIKLATVSESIAEALASSDTLRILYQSHLEYFNLTAMTESARLSQVALTRVENLQKEVQALYAAGMSDSLGIIEANLSVNRARLQLSLAQDAKRRAEIRLLQLCGLPVNEEITIGDRLAPVNESATQDTLITRPELVAAQRRIGLAGTRISQQRSEWMPSLGAFAGYSYGKPNLDRFGNSWNDYWSAGAQLTWSFQPGGKNSHSIRRSIEEQKSAVQEFNRLNEQFKTEQLVAREKLQAAATSNDIQQERAILRADAFRLSQIQFREGILSATRLFDTEQLLSEAELSAALSLIDWYAARSGYWYARGSSRLEEGL